MSKTFCLILLLSIYSLNCLQEESKLEGKPITSDNELSKSLSNAFDGDILTEFTSSLKDGWIGLELSSPSKITKIGFAHLCTEPKDYLLGLFEGANDKTFFDAFPLYMITEELEPEKLHLIQISCSQTFKYIRYIGPEGKNSTISELEIYGDSELSEEEKEQKFYQPTNLPLLIINSGNSEMPQKRDKETKVNVNYILINEGKINIKQTGTIKLRGNSSLRSEKKPYSIVLDEEAKLLDIPAKAKKWILVPNMFDKTLMRNALGYHMSFLLGLKFTPACRYIDLIVNGNYRGNYMICERIEVKEGRLELAKMDETCVTEPEITGGYLLEGQGNNGKGDPSLFKTTYEISLSCEYPNNEDITEEQRKYIIDKINEVEAEISANNTDSLDLESFVRYFLIEDFSANQDEIFNSFFIYKERGDDKIYFGPTWDFDLAFDNAMILYPSNEKKNFAYKFTLSNGSAAKLVSQILSNEHVLKKVKDTWMEISNTVFTKEIIRNYINEQVELINESQKLNYMKWDVLNSKQFMEAVIRGSFEAEIEYLKEFVDNRFDIFGEIVSKATPESVLEETKRSWGGGGWNGGQGGQNPNPWGGWGKQGNNGTNGNNNNGNN